MHVSSANIIRFPEPLATAPSRSAEQQPAEPAEIVMFAPDAAAQRFRDEAQQHGQIHTAHRIVGRVADQLESVALL